jgi:hypothetical protein
LSLIDCSTLKRMGAFLSNFFAIYIRRLMFFLGFTLISQGRRHPTRGKENAIHVAQHARSKRKRMRLRDWLTYGQQA